MKWTVMPACRRMVVMTVCVVCVSCTYVLRFADKPKFQPVSAGGLTFTPAISIGDDRAVLELATSRPNPVTDEIDTIRLADISMRLDNSSFAGMSSDKSLAVTLQQDDNAEVLLETGNLVLIGRLYAKLPEGTKADTYDMVTVTYRGESAVSYLMPAK